MRTFSEWLGALIISLYPKHNLDGIRVIFTDTVVDRLECITRLRRAITMIIGAGPHYGGLIRRIRRIVVWPGDRTFADGAGGIHIASEHLVGVGDLALASVLVHESIHLRISDMGVRYEPQYRERIEHLCVAAQVLFLRSFGPAGEELARDAELVLAYPWWTESVRNADLARLLREHRIPMWLRTLLRRD